MEKSLALIAGINMDQRKPIFKIRGVNIKTVNKLKILGVTIDRILNFQDHLDSIKGSIFRMASNMDRVGRKHWGVRADTARTWYLAAVEPKILYAADVWFPKLNTNGLKRLI